MLNMDGWAQVRAQATAYRKGINCHLSAEWTMGTRGFIREVRFADGVTWLTKVCMSNEYVNLEGEAECRCYWKNIDEESYSSDIESDEDEDCDDANDAREVLSAIHSRGCNFLEDEKRISDWVV